MRIQVALFYVRSPIATTGWLGDPDGYGANNPCEADSDKYWHMSNFYQARAFDIATLSGGGLGPVYARLDNATGMIANVHARKKWYGDGWCGVDVSIGNTHGTRRLRYYHVEASAQVSGGNGDWVLLGSLPAYGARQLLLGSLWHGDSDCASADGWLHVHIDTAYSERGKGSGGVYEWINCSLNRPAGTPTPISPSTILYYL